MATRIFGKPIITGSVLRQDARARPVAVEPSLLTARGFPIHTAYNHLDPRGPDPRSVPSALVPLHKPRGAKSRARNPRAGTRHIPHIRTIGCPTRTEAIAIARARFNTGLTP